MAGFTVNGCGASDSYYLLKGLPGHPCRSCGKADYALMELKMKIRVFYIPTIPVRTRYAVVCPKCKNGYYVSETQKNYILSSSPDCVTVGPNGLTIHGLQEQIVEEAADSSAPLPEAEVPAPQPKPQTAEVIRCKCGTELPPQAAFCFKCGARMQKETPPPAEPAPKPAPKSDAAAKPAAKPEPILLWAPGEKPHAAAGGKMNDTPIQDKPAFVYKKAKVCPECGMRMAADKAACSICGTRLP